MKRTNNSFPDASNIIDKLKLFYQFSSDAALAKLLDIRANTLAIWKVRNSVDLKKIFECCPELDFNWLLDQNETHIPKLQNIEPLTILEGLFESYNTKGPIINSDTVFCIEGKNLEKYPEKKAEKQYFKNVPNVNNSKSLGWDSLTRIFKSGMSRHQWIITKYCFRPWEIKESDKVWLVTKNDIGYGEILNRIDSENRNLVYKTETGKIYSIKVKELEEAWIAQEVLARVRKVDINSINERIEKLEDKILLA